MTAVDLSTPMLSRSLSSDPALGEPIKRHHSRISWPAVIAAVVLVVSIQIALNVLGVGVGLGFVSPNTTHTPTAGSFGMGAALWWCASSLFSLALGGYVAAWLGGLTSKFDGMLHGLVTWGIATLATFYLLSSVVGAMIGGAFTLVGGGVTAAGAGLASMAPRALEAAGVNADLLQRQAQSFLAPAAADPATFSPADAQREIGAALPKLAMGDPEAAAAKERIITIAAAQGKMSREDATKLFDQAQAQIVKSKDQAVQAAKDAADASAKTGARASFLAFIVMVLGAFAAAIAGRMAVNLRPRASSAPLT